MDNEAEYQQKYQTYSDIIELAGQQKKISYTKQAPCCRA